MTTEEIFKKTYLNINDLIALGLPRKDGYNVISECQYIMRQKGMYVPKAKPKLIATKVFRQFMKI